LINDKLYDLIPQHYNQDDTILIANKLEKEGYIRIMGDDIEDIFIEGKTDKLLNSDKNSTFKLFWTDYHKITNMRKTDKEAALKKWKVLKDTEHVLAIKNIQDYYDSLNDKTYCKKARTYLGDKNFNDEFIKKHLDYTNSTVL